MGRDGLQRERCAYRKIREVMSKRLRRPRELWIRISSIGVWSAGFGWISEAMKHSLKGTDVAERLV